MARKTSAAKKPKRGRPSKRSSARARARAAVSNAPPPPEPNRPPPAELVAIADELARTKDPLEGNALAHKALLATMKDVLTDTALTPAARRKELRVIAAAAKDLLPDSRRWAAEEMIRQDRELLEAKSRQKKGAKLEPVPDAKVIEVDFGGAPPAELEPAPVAIEPDDFVFREGTLETNFDDAELEPK